MKTLTVFSSASVAALLTFGAFATFTPSAPVVSGVAAGATALAADASAPIEIDVTHSTAFYRIKHMDAAYNWGRFNDISGTFRLNKASPESSVIDVTIKTESVDTFNKKRDDHLRSADFFDVKQFPTMTFKSKSARKTGENTFDVTGDLTILGKTKTITVPVEHTGEAKSEMTKKMHAGLEATFKIKRSEFGMGKMVGPIGDEVTIVVSLEGMY